MILTAGSAGVGVHLLDAGGAGGGSAGDRAAVPGSVVWHESGARPHRRAACTRGVSAVLASIRAHVTGAEEVCRRAVGRGGHLHRPPGHREYPRRVRRRRPPRRTGRWDRPGRRPRRGSPPSLPLPTAVPFAASTGAAVPGWMAIILHVIADTLSETRPAPAAIIHGAAGAYAVMPPSPTGPISPAMPTAPDRESAREPSARGARTGWDQAIAWTLAQATKPSTNSNLSPNHERAADGHGHSPAPEPSAAGELASIRALAVKTPSSFRLPISSSAQIGAPEGTRDRPVRRSYRRPARDSCRRYHLGRT